MKTTISIYLELMKPRILLLVLITTTLGYFLGGRGISSYGDLFLLLLGVSAVCGGSAALNHYLERDVDAKMERTRNRPLVQGLIPAEHALNFGVLLVLCGVSLLCWKINLLTAFLSLLTAFLYVLVYTPLKKVSWLNTTIGAVPGALPPLGGWAAATGDLSLGGWILFLILFAWQHPHFYSIAWLCRQDYKNAGFKMLPSIDQEGKRTFQQIHIYSVLLIIFSLLPTFMGLSGRFYFLGALFAGIYLFKQGQELSLSKSNQDAKKLLKASVFYLPIIFALIVIDVTF